MARAKKPGKGLSRASSEQEARRARRREAAARRRREAEERELAAARKRELAAKKRREAAARRRREAKERELAAARKRELAAKKRRARRRAQKLREARELLEEQKKIEERNRQRRERRRKKKVAQRPEPPPPPPPPAPRAEHPLATPEDLVAAELVRETMRNELSQVAEEVGDGTRSRTHLYEETGDIDGFVWKEAADNEIGTSVGAFGDAFRPLIGGLFYSETFFQGVATFILEKSDEARVRRGEMSPLDESRLGPNGAHYRTANTHWFRGDAQKALATIEYMVASVQGAHPEFTLVKIGLRLYWSPVQRRPER